MQPSHLKIGSNIRKWRQLKDFEAKEFAQLLDISTGALSNIENNITNLTLTRLTEIAELLKIAPEKLFVDPLSLLPPPDKT
jgi:transcriptional regulator with XRE-family HTH domain